MPKLTLLTVYRVLFDRMGKGKLWKRDTQICSNRDCGGHVGSTAGLELLRVIDNLVYLNLCSTAGIQAFNSC
jgi:hypothetical protein